VTRVGREVWEDFLLEGLTECGIDLFYTNVSIAFTLKMRNQRSQERKATRERQGVRKGR
jgi:hypothetical protein